MKASLIKKQADKEGYVPVYIMVRDGRTRWQFPAGVKVPVDQWDASTRRVTGKGDVVRETNMLLEMKLAKVQQAIRQAHLQERPVTRQLIAEALDEKKAATARFSEVVDAYIEWVKERLAYNTWRIKRGTFAQLLELHPDLTTDAIDAAFLENYYWELGEHGLSQVSAEKKIRYIKTFLQWAWERKHIQHRNWEGAKIQVREQVNKTFLTQRELEQLEAVDLSDTLYIDRARDVFVFACYTGLRWSDLDGLRRDHIKSGQQMNLKTRKKEKYHYIEIVMQKTHKTVFIPLTQGALRIVKKYEADEKPLPVISNQKLNDYIKLAAQLAGIDAPVVQVRHVGKERIEETAPKWQVLSTHCARSTFITLAEERGVPLTDIQRIVGHAQITQTAKYTRHDKHKLVAQMREAFSESQE